MIVRGLTMIETLLAIALLTLVVGAAASWTAMAGRLALTTITPARETGGVEAVFRLIHTDLVSGDFELAEKARPGTKPPPRVSVQVGVLEIRTRAVTIRRYRFDRANHRLERESTGETKRVLLYAVHDFFVKIDEEAGVLDVAITNDDDSASTADGDAITRVFTRRFNLP